MSDFTDFIGRLKKAVEMAESLQDRLIEDSSIRPHKFDAIIGDFGIVDLSKHRPRCQWCNDTGIDGGGEICGCQFPL